MQDLIDAFKQLGASVWIPKGPKGCPDAIIGAYGIAVPVYLRTTVGAARDHRDEWRIGWLGGVSDIRDKKGVVNLLDTMRYQAGHSRL